MADETPSPELTEKPIPQTVRNLHLKALANLERNPDIAIDMMARCVKSCPWFLEARRNLHKTEIAQYLRKHGGKVAASPLAGALFLPKKMKITGLLKKGLAEEALQECEDMLMKEPLNMELVKLFAETAVAAKRSDAALMTLEVAGDHIPPTDVAAFLMMGKLYLEAKQYKKSRDFLGRYLRAKPTDSAAAKLLKDAEALDTLNSGWEQANKSGDYHDTLKSREEAEKLAAASKMKKTEADADSMIRELLQKIEKEPKNVNYYLALVGLYIQQKLYREGLDTIDRARGIIGQDPELDRRYADVKKEMFASEVAALREAGDEAGAAAKQQELDQYTFDDILERVQRYPNDQHLHFLLGEQYAKYGYPDDAIQQLQIAQKSPKDRVGALYIMAKCFHEKGMLDMAIEQLKSTLELLPSMDSQKMDVYYMLGELSEEDGNLEQSSFYFKEIYRADATYKDVADRVQRIYAKQKEAKNA